MRHSLGSKKVLAALRQGNPQPLIDFHRATFGNLLMEDVDDDKGGDDDSDEDDPDEKDADADKGEKDKKTATDEVAALNRENAQRRKEASALKKKNDELAAKLKEFEDKDKSDLDKASGEAAKAKAESEKLASDYQKLLIENAFLKDNKFTWVNPKAALKLADLSDVEIDDEGNVTGVEEALKALAKSDPYLLKVKKDEDEDDDDDKGNGATGQPVGGKKSKNTNRDKLLDKYPALRR